MPGYQNDLAEQYKLRVLKILAGMEGPDAETVVEEAWQGEDKFADTISMNMTLRAPGTRLRIRLSVDCLLEETR